MSTPHTDRNLLFGILALQMDFVTRDQLVAGMNAWVLEKRKSLGQVLMDRRAIDPAVHEALAGMVELHIREHGDDPQLSLASLESATPIREVLSELADEDVRRSLGLVVVSALSQPAMSDATTTSAFAGRPTATGGRFRVLRFHAKGGLGEVFVARDEEVRREVALKQIQERFADEPQSRARFEVEAEVTGRLEHPGIVPVYGLGHHDDGRPFYAMRFIRGSSLKEAISKFHDDDATSNDPSRRSLALRELLNRFLDVCDAIAYAHSRGVLHRDLKPGNIMLGDYGETLVVDWGLAKPLGRRDPGPGAVADDATIHPESGSRLDPTHGRVGTLGFMPPEQAARRLDELGPRSDVYSLGATLYSLVTGHAPFRGNDAPELLERIEAGEFPRPRSLQPWIDPALEAVCLKAMSRQPADRYDSPRSLAADLKSWLADEPVAAYREPFSRRARRWGRKHRTLVATATATVLLATLGLASFGAVLSGKNRDLAQVNNRLVAANAEVESWLGRAMASIEDYFTGVSAEALAGDQLPRALRDRLLEKPRQFYEQLTEEISARPDPGEAERSLLAKGRYGLGRIHQLLGLHEDAEREFLAAIATIEALADARPEAREHRAALARAQNSLGLSRELRNRLDEAAAAYLASIENVRALLAHDPEDGQHRVAMAQALVNVGNIYRDKGRAAESEAAFLEAIEQARAVDLPGSAGVTARDDVAKAYNNLSVLRAVEGRHAEAADACREAIRIREGLLDEPHYRDEVRRGLGNSHMNLGRALAELGDRDRAAESLETSAGYWEDLGDAHPSVPSYAEGLASALTSLSDLQKREGEHAAAEQSLRRIIAATRKLAEAFPAIASYRSLLVKNLHNLGLMLDEIGRPGPAAEAYEEAIRAARPAVEAFPDDPSIELVMAKALSDLGVVHGMKRDLDQAAEAFEEASEHYESVLRRIGDATVEDPVFREARASYATTLNNQGVLEKMRGRLDEAARIYRRACDVLGEILAFLPNPEGSDATYYRNQLGSYHGNLAEVQQLLGRLDEALASAGASVEIRAGAVAASPELAYARLGLGRSHARRAGILEALGRLDEAEADHGETIRLLGALAAAHPEVSEYRYVLGVGALGRGLLRARGGRLGEARDDLGRALAETLAATRLTPGLPAYQLASRQSFAALASLLHDQGRADELVAAARERFGIEGDDEAPLVEAARTLAREATAPLGAEESPVAPEARREALSAAAVAVLRAAARPGWARSPSPLDDPAWRPLRDREDFRALRADQAMPNGPGAFAP